jgi:hypothetical protein
MTKGNSFRMNDSLSSSPGERRKKFLFLANREEITASLSVCVYCVCRRYYMHTAKRSRRRLLDGWMRLGK